MIMNTYMLISPLLAMSLMIGANVVNFINPPKIEKAIVFESKTLDPMFYQEVESEVKTYRKNEQLSSQELKDVLYQAGFRGKSLRQAWGVAMKESTGRPKAHNDNPATGDNSYGLFQINMIGSLGPARLEKFNLESNKDLFDPVRNAEIAYFMSNKGKDWSAWHGITDKTLEWMQKFPNN
jgi:hypothetical protein